jgi:citrate lyase beta subunit
VSNNAPGSAFETYLRAGFDASARSDHAAAGALFSEALSELEVTDPQWPMVWIHCMAARVRAGDPVAQVEAAADGVVRMVMAAPLDVPLAQADFWFEAAFFALSIPGIREIATTVLAPLAIPFAAGGRRHLSHLAAGALDRMAVSLLEQGRTEDAAVLDARLLRISPARARSINLDLTVVRARHRRETARVGGRS